MRLKTLHDAPNADIASFVFAALTLVFLLLGLALASCV